MCKCGKERKKERILYTHKVLRLGRATLKLNYHSELSRVYGNREQCDLHLNISNMDFSENSSPPR